MADENSQYLISSDSGGVCQTLPLDSRFARKLSRGAMGKPNEYVTLEQATVLKKYIPTVRWSKPERIVYIAMQNYIDKTGVAPTAKQIVIMSMQASLQQEGTVDGLTESQANRALDKLRKRGIVFEM